MSRANPFKHSCGLSGQMLDYWRANPDAELPYPGTIAERFGFTLAHLRESVRQLRHRGLIEVVVRLTPELRAAIKDADAQQMAFNFDCTDMQQPGKPYPGNHHDPNRKPRHAFNP